MSESFFSRWSRRKQEVAQDTQPLASRAAPPPASDRTDEEARPAQAGTTVPPRSPDAQALPTLDDVRSLTPQSDFGPFMRPGVGPEVRNAAMKKLFADPHFNVMDGLDIYIDDYNRPDPMPAALLRQMASAQFLKLVPEATPPAERPAQDPAAGAAVQPLPQVVAQSPLASASAETEPHDHPDLQLQPDAPPADPPAGSRPG